MKSLRRVLVLLALLHLLPVSHPLSLTGTAGAGDSAYDLDAIAYAGVGGGGYLYCAAFNRTDPDEIVIGTDMTGPCISTDFGATWLPWSDGVEMIPGQEIGPKHQGTFFQDLLHVEHDGQTRYFAASVGGILSAQSGATWRRETEQYWYTYADDDRSIPFSCLAWTESRSDLLLAGAGLNRFRDYNGNKAYPGLGSVEAQHPYSGAEQYTVWKKVLADPWESQAWEPVIDSEGVGALGPARDISVAQIDGTWYAAVTTGHGIFLYDSGADRWRALHDYPLLKQWRGHSEADSLGGTWYGRGRWLWGWTVHLTERGTLYVAMQRETADQTFPSGVYHLPNIRDLGGPDNPDDPEDDDTAWLWVGDDEIDVAGWRGGYGEASQYRSLGDRGVRNVYGEPISALVYFSVLEPRPVDGLDPSEWGDDVLILGDRGSHFGLFQGRQPYRDDNAMREEIATWTCWVYHNGHEGEFITVDANGGETDFGDETGWNLLGGSNVRYEPAITSRYYDGQRSLPEQSSPRFIVSFGCRIHSSDDWGASWRNAYCTGTEASGWQTTGWSELAATDLDFFADGRVVGTSLDFGVVIATDPENSGYERWEHPVNEVVDDHPSAVAVEAVSNWDGEGRDALFVVSGDYKRYNQAMFDAVNTLYLVADITARPVVWDDLYDELNRDLCPVAPNFVRKIWDVVWVGDGTIFISYQDYDSVLVKVGKGAYAGGAWSFSEHWQHLDGCDGRRLEYDADNERLYLTTMRRDLDSGGGLFLLRRTAGGWGDWQKILGADDAGGGELVSCTTVAHSRDGTIVVAGGSHHHDAPGGVYINTNALEDPAAFTLIEPPSSNGYHPLRYIEAVAVCDSDTAGVRILAGTRKDGGGYFNPDWGCWQYDMTSGSWTNLFLGTVAESLPVRVLGVNPARIDEVFAGTWAREFVKMDFPYTATRSPEPDGDDGDDEGDEDDDRSDSSINLRIDAINTDFAAGSNAIWFSLVSASRLDLRIFDLRGRLTRAIPGTDYPAGEHSIVWDGRNRFGARSASGVYLVHLQAGREVRRAKMVIVN